VHKMNSPKTSEDVKRRAEAKLGRRLTSKEMNFARKYGHLPGPNEPPDFDAVEDLARVISDGWATWRDEQPEYALCQIGGRRQRRLKSYQLRRRVLSELMAGIAERDQAESLAWFRERWLPGALLPQDPTAVQGWVDALWQESKTKYRLVMDELRGIARGLSGSYGWTMQQAIVFVLSGWTPPLSSFAVTIEPGALKCNTRITLRIDPALAPREVAERYARWRNRLLPQRARSLSDKHLELAGFASRLHSVSEDDLKRWNEQYGKRRTGCGRRWAYKSLKAFRRDVRAAKNRLLWPAYRISPSQWKSPSKKEQASKRVSGPKLD